MKVFVAGATGVLGRRLVAGLAERGHDVVGLARRPENDEVIRACGGWPARADLFDADSLVAAAEGAEVVIHAATAIPSGPRARFRKAWAMNDALRREGTRALTAATARIGARRYLQQSVVWVVRWAGPDRPYDESTPPDPPVLLGSAIDGERIASGAGAHHGFQVGILRGGSFYGPDTMFRDIAAQLEKHRMPVLGRGDYLLALIHADDCASAFVAAAESEAEGIWHVVDDEPVESARLLRHFAEALGTPPPRHLPRWVARALLGRGALEALTTSMNTSNAKIRRELGWAPAYPTYREGIPSMIEAWEDRAGDLRTTA